MVTVEEQQSLHGKGLIGQLFAVQHTHSGAFCLQYHAAGIHFISESWLVKANRKVVEGKYS